MTHTRTKALLFDLGKVLVPFDFTRAYAKVQALTGLSIEEIRARLAATSLFRDFETGLMDAEDFAGEVMRVVGFTCDPKTFEAIWTSIFSKETLIPETAIRGLGEQFRLLIVSNTNIIHFEMLKREYPIFEHFHDFVLSYEVRAMKPAAAFYQAALAKAQCRPEECVFIDDLLENVEGARAAGFDGIHFQSFEQLGLELKARGIRVRHH